MKRIVAVGCMVVVAMGAILQVRGDMLCLGESTEVKIDLTTGTRTAGTAELIRYSVGWVAGASAVVEVNGTILNSVSGVGFVEWTPMSNGTYTLTHKVLFG